MIARICWSGAIVLAMIITACSSAPKATATATASGPAINCGNPTALSSNPRYPALKGVVIGPVIFTGFDTASGKAVITAFTPGSRTKVVIQPAAPLTEALRLEGFRCSTGERLRLDYGASRNAVAVALLPAGTDSAGTPVPYVGFMRFTAAGKWLISVSTKAGHLIGSAVFSVQ